MNSPSVQLTSLHPRRRLTPQFKTALRRLMRRVLVAARHRRALVSVVFMSDRRIRTLNRTYHHRDHATDVLAFGFYHDNATRSTIGDIYVSLDQARTQARAYGVTFENEVARLTIHGTLHLCGRRDDTLARRKNMNKETEKWIRAL